MSFDAVELSTPGHVMGEAFDIARKNMQDDGQPKMVLEFTPKRIIQIVRNGERDPAYIAGQALAAIGLQHAG